MKHKFDTVKDAVFAACEEVGPRSSVAELLEVAQGICHQHVRYVTAAMYRSQWRRQHGIEANCSTYEGQPRRNMLNDHKVSLTQCKRLANYLKQHDFQTLMDLFGQGDDRFHSLDQLQNALAEVNALQIHVVAGAVAA